MTAKTLQPIIFYSILLLTPANLAKHWLSNWSFVNGVLVDYYLPALYLTDILIITLLITWLWENKKQNKQTAGKISSPLSLKFKQNKLFFLLLFLLILNLIFSKNVFITGFKSLKLIEFALFFCWIKSKRKLLKTAAILKIISLAVLIQSLLGIAQWFNQSFIFGYLFLGEQPFTSATLGIKLVSFLGQLKIPPYGTFSHPNVLAGFLNLSLIFITYHLLNKKSKNSCPKTIIFISLTFLAALTTLLLTFSFPAILGFLATAVFFAFLLKYKKLAVFTLLTTALMTTIGLFFLEPSSWQRRNDLNKIAFNMFKDSPFLGVGLGNFIVNMEKYDYIEANYRFLQPVHNLGLLILSETGFLGFLAISYITLLTVLKEQKKKNYLFLLIGANILFLGAVDHYWLTIQQGLLSATVFLGLTSTASTPASSASSSSGKTS